MNSSRSCILCTVTLVCFSVLAVAALLMVWRKPAPFAFDEPILFWIISLRTDALTSAMAMITFFGKASVVWALTIGLSATFALSGAKKHALMLFGSVAGASLLTALLKEIIARPRPEFFPFATEHGFSFPSGHVMFTLAFFGILVYFFIRRERSVFPKVLAIALLGLWVFLIGFSRVYLGVHWPSDVMGSVVIGGAWVAFAAWWAERAMKKEREEMPT